jgi:diguanylate cyclase (GGDEF)-like protein
MNGSSESMPLTGQTKHPVFLPYMYCVISLGCLAVAYAIFSLLQMHLGYKWLILAFLTIVSSPLTIRIPATNAKMSIGDTFFFTNIVLFGTPVGIITAALDALVASIRARSRSRRLQFCIFNVAALSCTAFLSGTVFFRLLNCGPLYGKPAPSVLTMITPLAALALSHYVVNSGSIATIVALEKRKNIIEIWKESFIWTSVTYLAGATTAGFVALSTGSPFRVIGAFTLVIGAIYLSYKTYLDKVQQTWSMAYYDSLTGLPNRHLFREQLNNALEISRRSNQTFALMFLDLDNFKRINDTYGHGAGDALLKSVAARLISTLRSSHRDDSPGASTREVVIGRFGGDEFNLMLMGIGPQVAGVVAKRILASFSSPFALEGQEIIIGASIGISICPSDGNDADTLLKNADAAMFHAKEVGKSGFRFYSQSMNELSLKKLALENDLHKALNKEEFRVFYQPKVHCRTEAVVGAEALTRWQHPSRGLVLPDEFIQVAEETGLICPIGEWVLRSVCRQLIAWKQAGIPAVPISVNLSTVQFRQQNLLQLISEILRETAVDPAYLQFEITESMIMQNEEEADALLRDLRALGCKISIDDFGTGYSSLSRLKRFSLDALKIDRSFVKDLATSRDDRAITKAIIAMAHSLELKVIAEGVETQEQFQFLRSLDCDEIQGCLFSKPLPEEDFIALLVQQLPTPYIEVQSTDLADW